LAAIAVLSWGVPAAADPSPGGHGIAGGVLLGGEVAVFGEAIAGLDAPWLYWAGAGVGAVGGGLGGYYVESGGAPRTSYYMLAGGMALSIPAMVVYLNATNEARHAVRSEPSGPDYDEEPLDELDDAAVHAFPQPQLTAAVDWDGNWRLQAPGVVVSPTFTPLETALFDLPASTQVVFPIVAGAF
jgi:hypothetical protein